MKIAIVSGVIGGMTLALSLAAAGINNVDVHESAPAIRELGVGITVFPHAVRELTELGLLDALSAVGSRTAEHLFYSKHGQRVWSEPLGMTAGYRWPMFAIQRGELLRVLYRAVMDRLGARRVHAGHHLSRFGHDPRGTVWGELVDHTMDLPAGRVEADVPVGCDGIHSRVRRTLYPEESPLRWNAEMER